MEFTIDKNWTLFLDRDGVINEKLDNDYVKSIEEFTFIQGAKEAIKYFTETFGRIVIVTNQQGIGKGLMTHEDLKKVHDYMSLELLGVGAKIDEIYYCPTLAAENTACRKPNTGMAMQAKADFPEIVFEKSVLIGDSFTDIQMGKRVNMKTVYLVDGNSNPENADFTFKSLAEFEQFLKNS